MKIIMKEVTKTITVFEEWKQCKTMGEFFDRLDKVNEREINEWKQDREKYLNKCKTWV